jgi:uncharacterized protein
LLLFRDSLYQVGQYLLLKVLFAWLSEAVRMTTMDKVIQFPGPKVASADQEQDLNSLLRSLSPSMGADVYVYAKVRLEAMTDEMRTALEPVLEYRETEGVTVITTQDRAKAAGLRGVFPCHRITLHVDSALEAVGLMAAVTGVLASEGIPANPVSGFHHDHLYVPLDRAGDALEVLEALWADAQEDGFDFFGPDEDFDFDNDDDELS